MFERFTERAIKVIMLAQEEARRLGHNFLGTEQMLLGLIGQETGIAARALACFEVQLNYVRSEVEAIVGRGTGFVSVEIPFTPRAKRVLELSWDRARQLGHNYIGTEHLLLGLLDEARVSNSGVAAKVLIKLGIDFNQLEAKVLEMAKPAQETYPEVDAFARAMRSQLVEKSNTYGVRGWRQDNPMLLLAHLAEEVGELAQLVRKGADGTGLPAQAFKNRVRKEAADIANMSLMIADLEGALE